MPPINFGPLFMTARVLRATYQIAITSVLLITLASRLREKRRINGTARRIRDV